MKTVPITMLIATALLLSVDTQAFAATTWEAFRTSTPASQDVNFGKTATGDNGLGHIFYTRVANTYSFSNVAAEYNSYLSSNSNLLIGTDCSKISNLDLLNVALSNPASLTCFTDASGRVIIPQFSTLFSGSAHKLDWSIGKADAPTAFAFMAGTAEIDGGAIDHTNIAAAPIPAAAWLLASGILCLVGLKRKM
jgi:hypothetical protein